MKVVLTTSMTSFVNHCGIYWVWLGTNIDTDQEALESAACQASPNQHLRQNRWTWWEKETHDVFVCQSICHLWLCLIVKICLLWFNLNYQQHIYLHVHSTDHSVSCCYCRFNAKAIVRLAWRLLLHETAVATTYWVVCWMSVKVPSGWALFLGWSTRNRFLSTCIWLRCVSVDLSFKTVSCRYSHFRLARTRLTRNVSLHAHKPLVQHQIALTHILYGFR